MLALKLAKKSKGKHENRGECTASREVESTTN